MTEERLKQILGSIWMEAEDVKGYEMVDFSTVELILRNELSGEIEVSDDSGDKQTDPPTDRLTWIDAKGKAHAIINGIEYIDVPVVKKLAAYENAER